MSGKGSISRMSDECLITLETVFLFYIDCQAVMRKFTLAGKTIWTKCKSRMKMTRKRLMLRNLCYHF